MGSESGGGGGDPGQPPPPRSHEMAQGVANVSFSYIMNLPGVIGRVGRFLPAVADDDSATAAGGNYSSDVMNLLLCVGPKTATVVRKDYLRGNYDYMYFAHCLKSGSENGKSLWLDYNEDEWKDRVDNGMKSDEYVRSVSFEPDEHASYRLKLRHTIVHHNTRLVIKAYRINLYALKTGFILGSSSLFIIDLVSKLTFNQSTWYSTSTSPWDRHRHSLPTDD